MAPTSVSGLRPAALPPGENVLLVGPPMSGKRHLLYDLLGGTPDRSSVVVSTKNTAARIRREFLDAQPDPDQWSLGLIDCVSKGGVETVTETPNERYVSSPSDLTGIGIAASGLLQRCYHDPARRRSRFGLHSLSTLLMYADIRRVYQFTHVLTTRIEAAGFSGVFVFDTTADDEALATLGGLFDVRVETREGDNGPELRVRGADFGPRVWTPY